MAKPEKTVYFYRMQQTVIERITQELSHFPEVERVTLFGSRARGDNSPFSDIDIAVSGYDIDWHKWGKIRRIADVEDDTIRTLLKVDMVHLENAGDDLRSSIMREGKTLYERH